MSEWRKIEGPMPELTKDQIEEFLNKTAGISNGVFLKALDENLEEYSFEPFKDGK